MSFELKQLKSILALEAGGNMRKAAYQLCLSQSALSHQFRELEHRVGGELFIRNSVPLIFTQKGQVLLSLAKKILPQVSKAHQQLMQKNMTHHNIVIDIQCHACFQWLLPIIQKTSNTFHYYEFEFEFGNSSFLSNHQSQAGLLFSDDENNNTYNATQKIGSVELLAILPKHHALTQRKFIDAEDFALQTLLTYPVEKDRLDIFNLLLRPKHVQPAQIKQVDNSHVILQMVAANMGIAILPNWLVTSMAGSIVSRR
ncbi:LysR substrate-binding domain-containing protein [Colwellia sp. MB02u-14]|uniref:LysR substrate-binding domain-containing protein n=1 Tax=Colwellia sp. MB02u-14 TaxID=2759815 RepID=UPI0015F40B63|nr:LysR substrate-binding domain-containing protein [Colwellia sp. MB02u-14]MBA6303176.1 LysR family transcriptional regulator [Colwellia sp. MB02u-14]